MTTTAARTATSTRPMRHALVVADGDVPARAALDAAWPGWDAGVADVIAADGGSPRAWPWASGPTSWSAISTRSTRRSLPQPGRRHPDRRAARRQGRVGHRAGAARGRRPGCDADHRPRRVRRPAAGPRAGQRVAARAPGARGAADRPARRAARGPRSSRRPDRDGGPVTRTLPGPARRRSSSLLPLGGDVAGITTRGLALPAPRTSRCATGPARGLSNVRESRGRRGHGPRRPAPGRRDRASRTAGYPPGHEHAQAGDPAPEVALPDEHGTLHRLADRRGSWTVVYFYPKDDTPGCTTEACEFRDLHADIAGLDAEVWGDQPGRLRQPRGVPGQVRPPVHAPLRRGPRGRRGVRRVGREDELRQDVHGDRPVELPRGSRTDGSPAPGRRSRPRATRPRCSPPSAAAQAAAAGLSRA